MIQPRTFSGSAAENGSIATSGPPLTRQFTRDEYSQTVRDLLQLNFDAAQEAGIPYENIVDGFASRAGGLVIEPSLVEK